MSVRRKRKNTGHWGSRLKRVLNERSVSSREVARICDVSPSVVSGWVNDGNSPTDLMSIQRLCQKLEISFSWLLTGVYENGKQTPALAEIFDELPYFDGYARIRIDRLIPKKEKSE